MRGSEFVSLYANKGFAAWESAAVALALEPNTPSVVIWPWRDVSLSDGKNTLVVRVQSDMFSIGTPEDFVRLPLTPMTAQRICNQFGWLMPTPLLTFRIWQNGLQMKPTAMVPNTGANLLQYAAHSDTINKQISAAWDITSYPLVAGIKKHVVISNIMVKGKVVIFGWYKPSPPNQNIFDDHQPMTSPTRQPTQPLSNVHGDFYVDYSHGIQGVAGTCLLNGNVVNTADVYRDPIVSKLVSHEGPLRQVRYGELPSPLPAHSLLISALEPGYGDYGLSQLNRVG